VSKAFFLLNEGQYGQAISVRSTITTILDRQVYHKNIYAERNPGVVQELGDVGNDLQIYGDKLYAVINCSHFCRSDECQHRQAYHSDIHS
jgi:hypothetical protein